MAGHPVFSMSFAKVYPLLVQKAERKGRTKAEVDEVICWLTGYDADGLQSQIDKGVDLTTFYRSPLHESQPRFDKRRGLWHPGGECRRSADENHSSAR